MFAYLVALLLTSYIEGKERELTAQTRSMSIFEKMTRYMDSGSEIDDALEGNLHVIMESLGMDAGAIWLADNSGEKITLRISKGISGNFIKSIEDFSYFFKQLSASENSNNPIIIDSTTSSCNHYRDMASTEGIKSSIFIPIIFKGRTMGMILVGNTKTDKIDCNETRLLDILKTKIGMIFENIWLMNNQLTLKNNQDALADLSREFMDRIKSNTRLDIICRKISEILDMKVCILFLMERGVMMPKYGINLSATLKKKFHDLSMPIEDCWPWLLQAIKTNDYVYIDDVIRNIKSHKETFIVLDVRSVIFLPVSCSGHCKGVLMLYNPGMITDLTEKQISMAKALAGSAGDAVKVSYISDNELNDTKIIETGSNPINITNSELYDISYLHYCSEGVTVGKEFLDFIDLGRSKIGIVMAELNGSIGEGVDVASILATMKNIIRAYSFEDPSPHAVLAKTNRMARSIFKPNIFMTLIYGVLDTRTGRFAFGNAGHEYPILFRKTNSRCTVAPGEDTALGIYTGEEYESRFTNLDEGDALIIYTNGLLAFRDAYIDEDFTIFERVIAGEHSRGSLALTTKLYNVFFKHSDSSDKSNEVTILAIKRNLSEELEKKI